MKPQDGSPNDPRFVAVVDLVGRSGSSAFQIRYDEEQDPVVWVAVAQYPQRTSRYAAGFECDCAPTPLGAVLRLAQRLIDGGRCVHCRRETRVSDRWDKPLPLAMEYCWYVFDPETVKFRRSCEGEATVDRNARCPCGSGRKFKNCHGA